MPASKSYAHRRTHWTTYRDDRLRKGRMGRPYRRWRAQVLAAPVPICWRCGGGIDKSLPWRHPLSATAGHIVPLSRGGAPLALENGAPEHRVCNLRAGNKVAGEPGSRTKRAVDLPIVDRRW